MEVRTNMTDKEVETKDDAQEYTDVEVENHRANGEHDTAQPPKSHGNSAHDEDYVTLADVPEGYTDGDAISAVDGSNASVGYADNAGQLGGQSPSAYETPANTGQTAVSGGWSTEMDVSSTVNYTENNTHSVSFQTSMIDSVDVIFSPDTGDEDIVTLQVAGLDISSTGSLSNTYNINPTLDDSIYAEISTSNTGDNPYTLEVRIHTASSPPHTHTL